MQACKRGEQVLFVFAGKNARIHWILPCFALAQWGRDTAPPALQKEREVGGRAGRIAMSKPRLKLES